MPKNYSNSGSSAVRNSALSVSIVLTNFPLWPRFGGRLTVPGHRAQGAIEALGKRPNRLRNVSVPGTFNYAVLGIFQIKSPIHNNP